MAETNAKKEEVVEQPVAKKVIRRGVGSARGTSRLKFSHEQAKPNGLFLGHLDAVTVRSIKIGEDTTGMPSFNGFEIPRIDFTFASNEEEADKRHYITMSFNAVESNVNTIPGGKEEWKVNTVLDWFKHILNVFIFKGREMTDKENEIFGLGFEDFNEQGEYVPVETETVIAAWKTLFENVANALNGVDDNKPVYHDLNNKPIVLWLKLIRFRRDRKQGWTPVNNGDLAFPTYVGEGCIEIFKQNTAPSIRLDAVKETILPMKIEKAKTPNMNSAITNSMNSMAGGIPVIDPMMGNSFGDIASAAGEDLPF